MLLDVLPTSAEDYFLPITVTLRGPLDTGTIPQAQDALRAARGPQARPELVVDVAAVTEVDSAGLAVLAGEAWHAQREGGTVRLRHASPALVRRLELAGWLNLFVLDGLQTPGPLYLVPQPRRRTWREETFVVPARLDLIPELRNRVVYFAAALGLANEELDDVRLAAGEAITNAYRHGCQGNANRHIGVRCTADPERLCIEVRDPGSGFDPWSLSLPDPMHLEPGGLGIHFMRMTMDRVEFEFRPGTTIVRLEKRLRHS
ncbi:MAG: ATP-binding protein [Armatimonadetes bacterium]|nr:ATP-binding protein [Armatimonadota bacterium]